MSRRALDDKLNAFLKQCKRNTPHDQEGRDAWLKTAWLAGMVPRGELEDGKYYYGICRNARVARWDAARGVFTYVRSKFGYRFSEDINHPEEDNGFDLFVPVWECVPDVGEIIKEPLGEKHDRSHT